MRRLALLLVLLAGCAEDAMAPLPPLLGLTTELVAEGLEAPVLVAGARGDHSRVFIAELGGRIRLVRDGVLQPEPFLDLSGVVSAPDFQGRGLVGFAIHPLDGRLFVSYTTGTAEATTSWIVSYRRTDPDHVDPASATVVMRFEQPLGDHNGGHILFGPDRMLYVSLGDGGSGLTRGTAQQLENVYGSILRVDVGRVPYGIPPDNPFVGDVQARPEIWSYGLRHPWRISFDRRTGDLYIADVGEDVREELNVQPAASRGGENWGWPMMEGSLCFETDPCQAAGYRMPIYEYDHGEGCSITGGHVYRGRRIPEIDGLYFFGDFCRGWIRSLRWSAGTVTDVRSWTDQLNPDNELIITFGEDGAGELYFATLAGNVYRIVPVRAEPEGSNP